MKTNNGFEIEFFTPKDGMAGLFGISFDFRQREYASWFFVKKLHRQWGYGNWWWNGDIHLFGLGPLCLFLTLDLGDDSENE